MTLDAHVRVEHGPFVLDVALRVAPGELVAVLGPNGAGKTTLLRALAGITPLAAGHVLLDGRTLDGNGVRVPANARGIGVVFQDYRLFPHLTVAQNVEFGPRCAGMRRGAARAAARRWLAAVGLTGLEDRRPAHLSGGEAQRVALARALAVDPRLLLLDEPLAALDAETRSDVRGLLSDVVRAFGGPVVLVTHDPLDALTLADRLLICEEGAIVQAGTPAQIVERPATRYVAQLVGLSLVRGTATGGVLRLDDGSLLVTADTSLSGPALAVVRPASVVLTRAEPLESSARNVWRRQVTSVQSLGDRVRVTLSGAPPIVADVTPAAIAEMRLAAGDSVWATVKAMDVTTYPDPAGRRTPSL